MIRSFRILTRADIAHVRPFHASSFYQGITDTLMETFRGKVDQSKGKTYSRINASITYFVTDKSFKDMMDIMAETPEWNMKLWKTTLEVRFANTQMLLIDGFISSLQAQTKSWTMYIPGVSSTVTFFAISYLYLLSAQDQVKGLKNTIAIMDAMHDDELTSPEIVKGQHKERIAASSGSVSINI
jgi:hypothetical protein